MQGCQDSKHRNFASYYGQNLLLYRDMAKYYYDFSLPVKQTPHQVITLGCQILICTWGCLIAKLKLYHFIALSARICYLYKHRSNQIRDYMHRIKFKKIIEDHFNCRQPSRIPSWKLALKWKTAGFENYGSTKIKIWNCNNSCISDIVLTGFKIILCSEILKFTRNWDNIYMILYWKIIFSTWNMPNFSHWKYSS